MCTSKCWCTALRAAPAAAFVSPRTLRAAGQVLDELRQELAAARRFGVQSQV